MTLSVGLSATMRVSVNKTLEGGTIEHAQQIANHESSKATKLYARTSDQITLDEVERIVI